MSMVCPQCASAFERKLVCPNCRVRLNYHRNSMETGAAIFRLPERSQQSPWSRICIGLLVAQGIYFGLKMLCTAGLLINAEEYSPEVWTDQAGPFVVLALQLTGLFLGGTLVGAGQRRGAAYGFFVGAFNGLLFLGLFRAQVPNFGPLSAVVEVAAQATFGLFSGWLGCSIWRPLEAITLTLSEQKEASRTVKSLRPLGLFNGPISWFRVLLGLAIAVAGSLSARKLLAWLNDFSHGALLLDDFHQYRFFIWGVMAVVLLLGSMVAGSAATNSLKQGLVVGLATTFVVIGHRFYFKGLAPVEWFMLTVGLTIGTCLVGSWFGGQLLPPLRPVKHRSRCGPLT